MKLHKTITWILVTLFLVSVAIAEDGEFNTETGECNNCDLSNVQDYEGDIICEPSCTGSNGETITGTISQYGDPTTIKSGTYEHNGQISSGAEVIVTSSGEVITISGGSIIMPDGSMASGNIIADTSSGNLNLQVTEGSATISTNNNDPLSVSGSTNTIVVGDDGSIAGLSNQGSTIEYSNDIRDFAGETRWTCCPLSFGDNEVQDYDFPDDPDDDDDDDDGSGDGSGDPGTTSNNQEDSEVTFTVDGLYDITATLGEDGEITVFDNGVLGLDPSISASINDLDIVPLSDVYFYGDDESGYTILGSMVAQDEDDNLWFNGFEDLPITHIDLEDGSGYSNGVFMPDVDTLFVDDVRMDTEGPFVVLANIEFDSDPAFEAVGDVVGTTVGAVGDTTMAVVDGVSSVIDSINTLGKENPRNDLLGQMGPFVNGLRVGIEDNAVVNYVTESVDYIQDLVSNTEDDRLGQSNKMGGLFGLTGDDGSSVLTSMSIGALDGDLGGFAIYSGDNYFLRGNVEGELGLDVMDQTIEGSSIEGYFDAGYKFGESVVYGGAGYGIQDETDGSETESIYKLGYGLGEDFSIEGSYSETSGSDSDVTSMGLETRISDFVVELNNEISLSDEQDIERTGINLGYTWQFGDSTELGADTVVDPESGGGKAVRIDSAEGPGPSGLTVMAGAFLADSSINGDGVGANINIDYTGDVMDFPIQTGVGGSYTYYSSEVDETRAEANAVITLWENENEDATLHNLQIFGNFQYSDFDVSASTTDSNTGTTDGFGFFTGVQGEVTVVDGAIFGMEGVVQLGYMDNYRLGDSKFGWTNEEGGESAVAIRFVTDLDSLRGGRSKK